MTGTTSTPDESAASDVGPAPRSAATGAPAPVASSTRLRLLCGVLAGPLYLVVSYAEALSRDGFDLTRNAFSYLSLGHLGWIQVINFVVSGLLFVVAATGIRRLLRFEKGGTWGPLLIGGMGVGMIAGGVFVADPAFGFPPGAPDGQPEMLSWHGIGHAIAFSIAMLAWIGACFLFARLFAAQRQRGWAAYSLITGMALTAAIGSVIAPPGAVMIYVAATLGWIWTSLVIARLLARLAG
jgi:hypothetical protein